MIRRARERFDELPPTAQRATIIVVVLIIAIAATLIYRANTGQNADQESPAVDDGSYSTAAPPPPSSSASVDLPPGMSERPTTSEAATSTPSRPSATATPEADAALGTIVGITDPDEWIRQFAIIWNSFIPTGGRNDPWRSHISGVSTTAAKRLLDRTGDTIWTGVIMNKSTVRPTSEPRARKLWTVDGASMWRVSTEVSIVSIDPLYAAADGKSQTEWDFYIQRQRDGTFRLDSWAKPSRANESANTYTPER